VLPWHFVPIVIQPWAIQDHLACAIFLPWHILEGMVLARRKKDMAQDHLRSCLKELLAVGSLAKGVADAEVNQIQKLIHQIAEKIERAQEPKSNPA
jgi:hypothetical protein